jgi:hypothetical protein
MKDMTKHRKTFLHMAVVAVSLVCGIAAADPAAEREYQTQLNLALKGNADSQFRIGEMYETGSGVKKDPAMAYIWYNKAAVQGSARAKEKVVSLDKAKTETAEEQSRVNAAMRALQQHSELEATKQRERERIAAEARAREKAAADAAAHARTVSTPPPAVVRPAPAAVTTPPPAAVTAPAPASVPAPAPVAAKPVIPDARLAPAKPADKPKEPESVEFSSNPCKGPQAKFLSTCN